MPPAITSTVMPKNVIRLMYSHHHASGFHASNRYGIQYITANISPDGPGAAGSGAGSGICGLFSSQGKTATTKSSAGLHLLRSSSELDRCCIACSGVVCGNGEQGTNAINCRLMHSLPRWFNRRGRRS